MNSGRYDDRGSRSYDRGPYGGRSSYSRSRGRRDRDERYRGDREAGGASHLARIHGTELDRVNCPFFFKMGACRHGDACGRHHNRPAFSQTVIIPSMYPNPRADSIRSRQAASRSPERQKDQENFDFFFVDVFEELSKNGEIEDIVICDNLCDHLMGNVYVKFFDEEDAAKCVKMVQGRFYQGRQLHGEFSPVTDFFQSRCRLYDRGQCDRGGNCNYMHIKRPARDVERDLFSDQPYKGHRSRPKDDESSEGRKSGSRSNRRSRSPGRQKY